MWDVSIQLSVVIKWLRHATRTKLLTLLGVGYDGEERPLEVIVRSALPEAIA